jgi:hypothetical protein
MARPQEYCALLLPHTAPEPAAARAMCRLPPLPGSDPAAVVHLASQHALGAELCLRHALPADMAAVAELLGTGHDAATQEAALLKAQGGPCVPRGPCCL